MVMRSTPTPDHTSQCAIWYRLASRDMSGLIVSGVGVSNTLGLYIDKQTDIEIVIVAVLPLGKQDNNLPETLPEPMHGIRHKKQGKCALVQMA